MSRVAANVPKGSREYFSAALKDTATKGAELMEKLGVARGKICAPIENRMTKNL